MATPQINYTDRDFESIRAALVNRIRSKFPNDWRDFTEGGIGMALLEITAYTFDILSFMLDESVRNQFLRTATDREAVIFLAELIGYKMRAATSASVLCEATLSQPQPVDVVLRAGTVVQAATGVVFEVPEDQQIIAGSTWQQVTLVEGETQEDTFQSNGVAFQEFQLTAGPVIQGSWKVYVDGFEWTEVDSLVFSAAASHVYSVRFDVEDFAYVRFGDGTSGSIPPNAANIVIRYRVGGGVAGNIPTRAIDDVVVDGLLEGSSPEEFVAVRLTNHERGSGGLPRETVENAKFWAPRTVAANGRAVTANDFDTLASRFTHPVYGSPAYAKARLKQRIPELNTVEVFLWSLDGYGNVVPPNTNLKNAVQAYFDNNGEGAVRIITVDVEVLDGENVFIDIDCAVTGDGTKPDSEVMLAVQQSLRSYFANPENQPGYAIRLSRLYNLIQTTDGVNYALIRRVTASKVTSEVIGTSDGVTQMWTWTTFEQPLAGTIEIRCGDYVITDDGQGNLTGDVDDSFGNTVDYDTGSLSFGFATPIPGSGEGITIEYRYPLTYQRSQTELAKGNGITQRFRGQLSHFPVVPGTVAFTDGEQTITDDESGGLVGDDIEPTGVNVIDYETGTYDFSFAAAPAEDRSLAALYQQLLSVNAGDVPIQENQLAVAGFMDVETRRE